MSALCPNCGRLNREGARFCASCQTPLAAVERLEPGQVLGGGVYRVVRPLGKGGMGAVWLVAQTRAFDRLAVLKEVIDYFDPLDPEARRRAAKRFEAEARTLGDLKHPGIPDLYAYFSEGRHAGTEAVLRNYLVMEYIEGQDLRSALTRVDGDTGQLVPGSALTGEDVLRYIIQICEVLEYLAGRQPPVVHNDIKPGNIIIDVHSGRAVLVDFGTAKTRYLASRGSPDRMRDSVYGTVGYAAPELYRGHSEPRSDVYSLAATAYHLLTDDDPRDHPAQYPALDTGQVPPILADMLRAALAEDVKERLTAYQFREKLQGYLLGSGIVASGQMELLTTQIRLLELPPGQRAKARIQIANRGQGHLRGEALSSQPWIDVADAFSCPPGQTCPLPIGIDTAGFVPDQVYAGAVTLTPGGGFPEVVPVQAASTSPSIEVAPGRVDFGTVSRGARQAPRGRVVVRNVGRAPARCRVSGMPAWLLVRPEVFSLKTGGEQILELTVRLGKVQSRRNEAAMTVSLDQGQSHRVEVELRIRGIGLFG